MNKLKDFPWFFASLARGDVFYFSCVHRTKGGRKSFRVYLTDDNGFQTNASYVLHKVTGLTRDIERDAVICPHSFSSYQEALAKGIAEGLSNNVPGLRITDAIQYASVYAGNGAGSSPEIRLQNAVFSTVDNAMRSGTIYYKTLDE